MTRIKLARFYQTQSERYHLRAVEAREAYEHYSRSWFWNWFTGIAPAWLNAWADRSVMAEAYALTARMLMGMEE